MNNDICIVDEGWYISSLMILGKQICEECLFCKECEEKFLKFKEGIKNG